MSSRRRPSMPGSTSPTFAARASVPSIESIASATSIRIAACGRLPAPTASSAIAPTTAPLAVKACTPQASPRRRASSSERTRSADRVPARRRSTPLPARPRRVCARFARSIVRGRAIPIPWPRAAGSLRDRLARRRRHLRAARRALLAAIAIGARAVSDARGGERDRDWSRVGPPTSRRSARSLGARDRARAAAPLACAGGRRRSPRRSRARGSSRAASRRAATRRPSNVRACAPAPIPAVAAAGARRPEPRARHDRHAARRSPRCSTATRARPRRTLARVRAGRRGLRDRDRRRRPRRSSRSRRCMTGLWPTVARRCRRATGRATRRICAAASRRWPSDSPRRATRPAGFVANLAAARGGRLRAGLRDLGRVGREPVGTASSACSSRRSRGSRPRARRSSCGSTRWIRTIRTTRPRSGAVGGPERPRTSPRCAPSGPARSADAQTERMLERSRRARPRRRDARVPDRPLRRRDPPRRRGARASSSPRSRAAARPTPNTLVVVTADHGEEFLDHGRHDCTRHSLFDELLHVPLVVRGPDVPAGLRVAEQVLGDRRRRDAARRRRPAERRLSTGARSRRSGLAPGREPARPRDRLARGQVRRLADAAATSWSSRGAGAAGAPPVRGFAALRWMARVAFDSEHRPKVGYLAGDGPKPRELGFAPDSYDGARRAASRSCVATEALLRRAVRRSPKIRRVVTARSGSPYRATAARSAHAQ